MTLNKIVRISLVLGTVVSLSIDVAAQKVWSLRDCLEHAAENNLQIEIAEVISSNGELDRQEANRARFPSLRASSGFRYNFGRNIDPTTNDFVPQNLGFNSINLSTDVLLYNGGRLRHQYQQALLNEKANIASRDQMIQNVHLDIALAYLSILFETEQKQNAEQQLALSQNQLDRVQKLIEVEQAPEADQYEWIAQSAENEQMILARETAIENAHYQLRNLLNIDPADPFQVDISSISENVDSDQVIYDFADTYDRIVAVRPEVAAFQLSEQAAEKATEVVRAQYMPSLFFGADLSTSYSTLAKTFDNFSVQRIPEDGVFINGEPAVFEQESSVPGRSFRTPYGDQLNQNLGVGLGVSLNIPIYSRGLKKVNLQRAENDLLMARNTNRQSLKNLELQIQQVLADLRNAHQQFEAGERRVEFLQNAYDNMEKRYALGMNNNYDLLDAQNRLNQGKNQLTIAKYDLLFRKKILAFYLGEDLAEDL